MIVCFASFALDSNQRQLTRESRPIHVTPKAFDLLLLLVMEAPRVVRKAELHERLWPGTFVSDATLVSLVKELRRALDDQPTSSPIIRTAHGVGYAFATPFERLPERSAGISRWIVAGGRRVTLGGGENLIGRDPASTVWLDVPGVSRRHARIVVGERALLEDLNSKNGTSLCGQPVTEQVTLHDGDRIQIGPIVIIYHASATGMSTETVVGALSRRRDKV